MKIRLTLTALVSCFLSSAVVAQTNLNMDFLGNLNDHNDTLSSFGSSYSACWGYTSADGREYALVGTIKGTSIVDITDSLNLREVSFIPGPTSAWREMKTYKNYAYIVTENGAGPAAGIQIIDLSNLPASASLAKTYVWVDTIYNAGNPSYASYPRAHSVSVSQNYLYLNGGNYNGIRILDISDPLNPQKAGVYGGPYVHDSFIRNDTIFASEIYGQGLDIIDARNKSHPTSIKLIQYPGAGTHNSWTTTDGNFLVTTDEIGATRKSLKIWDIRDLQNLSKVGEIWDTLDTLAVEHNVFIKGRLAYVAWYVDGIKVIDLSDPANPVEVGHYDTYPQPDNPNDPYYGAWGADPFFPSGKVIISDMQTGLYVVRYKGDKRGTMVGNVTDLATGQPIPDVVLHFKEPAITRWTGNNGRYVFGYAPGTYTVLVEKPGYVSKTMQLTARQNATDTVNISVADTIYRPPPLPTIFSLKQNYPNPFNSTTTIVFDLPQGTDLRITLSNMLGQRISEIVRGTFSAGTHSVRFDGSGLPSGMYFYTLKTAGFTDTRRMMLVK